MTSPRPLRRGAGSAVASAAPWAMLGMVVRMMDKVEPQTLEAVRKNLMTTWASDCSINSRFPSCALMSAF